MAAELKAVYNHFMPEKENPGSQPEKQIPKKDILAPEESPVVLKGALTHERPKTRRVTVRKSTPRSVEAAYRKVSLESAEAEILKELEKFYRQPVNSDSLNMLNKSLEEIGQKHGRAETVNLFNHMEKAITAVQINQKLSRRDIARQLKEVNNMLRKQKKSK